MARAKVNKLYRTFVKGLVTEAGFLTFPENASIDELNTVPKRKGSRSRRFGLQYEPDSTAVPIEDFTSLDITEEYYWKAVANNASLNFLSLQIGSMIYFFDTSSSPISDGLKAFSIDLLDYKVETATDEEVASNRVQMVAGKGFLFVVQEFINPFVVEYLSDSDDLEIVPILILIRDYDGVDDSLANDEEPATLLKEHLYNLKNQGWIPPGESQVGPDGGNTDPSPPDVSSPGYGGFSGWYSPWTGTSIP